MRESNWQYNSTATCSIRFLYLLNISFSKAIQPHLDALMINSTLKCALTDSLMPYLICGLNGINLKCTSRSIIVILFGPFNT